MALYLTPGMRGVCPAYAWHSVPDSQDEQVRPPGLAVAFGFSEINEESELLITADIHIWDIFVLNHF